MGDNEWKEKMEFIDLPDELIMAIGEKLEEMRDYYNFSMINKKVATICNYNVAKRRMKKKFQKNFIPTTSICYPNIKIKTFLQYKYRKLYKRPNYHPKIERTTELTVLTPSQIIVNIITYAEIEKYNFLYLTYESQYSYNSYKYNKCTILIHILLL